MGHVISVGNGCLDLNCFCDIGTKHEEAKVEQQFNTKYYIHKVLRRIACFLAVFLKKI